MNGVKVRFLPASSELQSRVDMRAAAGGGLGDDVDAETANMVSTSHLNVFQINELRKL